MKLIHIETYGCSANQNNSEILAGLLTQSNHQITNNPEIAEILIINTCIVKQKTEDKIKRKIQDLSKKYPKKLLIIAGCMPETDLKQLKKLAPNSIFLGTHNFKEITKLIKNYYESKLDSAQQKIYLDANNEEKLLLPKIPNNKLISITQISEGCLGECSYCKTRLAKGKLFSYEQDKIISSIESDLKNKAKEIWLTSQDCAAYYLDKNSSSQLPNMLSRILSINKNFKLRLGMLNPNHLYPILNQLIEIYSSPKIYKFLHIPVQSASDKILNDMKREYEISMAEEIIKKFKKEFPDMTIATDIITGYPTETEQEHKKNLEFIKKFRPDVFNLSKFSLHKNTEAGKLHILPINIINKRASELMSLHRETAKNNKEKFLNKKIKIFINNKTQIPNVFEARDENYNIVFIRGDKELLGKSIEVKIKEIGVHHMRALAL